MKRWFEIMLGVALVSVVAACGAAPAATESAPSPAPTEASASPTTSGGVESEATPTSADVGTEVPAQATPPFPTPHPNPECVAEPILADPNVPPVTDEDWSKGPDDAPFVLIEYADFQCPACAMVIPLLESLTDPETGQMRHVYRHFPLTSIHDKAIVTGEAVEAAGAQGAFWEMYDLLYERQADWNSTAAEDMPPVLSGYAKEIGLDVKAFDQALADHKYKEKVEAGYDESVALGLQGTPSFIVDGVHYPSQQLGFSEQGFDFFFRVMEMRRMQFPEPPPVVIEEGKQYQATIKTDKGDIVVELFAEDTPVTVNSFVHLAEQGWYDDTTFHRVIPGFMAQAGDPTATGMGWPGYRCSDELDPELRFDGSGVLGMANSGPDTNGSQFFITLDAQPSLDGHHTVFGRVVSGMDVVESLTARDPQTAPLDQPGDSILTIEIEEK